MDIKVGDIGTEYFVPTYDNDLAAVNFDPSLATIKRIIFRMPGAPALLTRTATAAQRTINSVATWGLVYTVAAADVVPEGFHQEAGPIALEGYLYFGTNQVWSSSIVTTDQQGRDLQVVDRLEA